MGISKWLRQAMTMISTAVAIEECSGDTESMKETKRDKRTSEPPRRPRPRIRRSVSDVFNCLGPHYFRRAYRMSYESFWKLHEELKEGIEKAHKAHNIRLKARKLKNKFKTMSKDKKNFYSNVLGGRNFKLPPVPNGRIDSSVWLACAIRYFAEDHHTIWLHCMVLLMRRFSFLCGMLWRLLTTTLLFYSIPRRCRKTIKDCQGV